jgi:uncharacterized protein
VLHLPGRTGYEWRLRVKTESPYHPGEIAVQERAGGRASATKIGRSVDDRIEPPAAHFLAQRYTLYVGSVDARGHVWASELAGPPGFVTVTDARTVHVDTAPRPDDPLAEALRSGPSQVGLLAIDLVTRRRYRVNGVARAVVGGGFDVAVAQAFGNCPKYIQRREPTAVVEPSSHVVTRPAVALDEAQRARIGRADTFFLATAHPTGSDVSHRGGRPGFVRTIDPHTLRWPDYQGNTMFLSLGNLAADARAGVLFVDFETGDLLQATGRASIDWTPEAVAEFGGAERVVELRIDAVRDTPGGSPLRWRLVEPSPFNP